MDHSQISTLQRSLDETDSHVAELRVDLTNFVSDFADLLDHLDDNELSQLVLSWAEKVLDRVDETEQYLGVGGQIVDVVEERGIKASEVVAQLDQSGNAVRRRIEAIRNAVERMQTVARSESNLRSQLERDKRRLEEAMRVIKSSDVTTRVRRRIPTLNAEREQGQKLQSEAFEETVETTEEIMDIAEVIANLG